MKITFLLSLYCYLRIKTEHPNFSQEGNDRLLSSTFVLAIVKTITFLPLILYFEFCCRIYIEFFAICQIFEVNPCYEIMCAFS